VNVKVSLRSSLRNLKGPARLKIQLRRAHITHDRVAAEAHVSRTMIVHVLSGRFDSKNVIATAKRLLAEAKAARVAKNGGAA